MPMKHSSASHQCFYRGKRSMYWSFRMSLYSILTNTAGDHGLRKISNRSGRREMDMQSMCPTSYLRPLDGSSYPTIRLLHNLHCRSISIYLRLTPERLLTLERASTRGGTSPS